MKKNQQFSSEVKSCKYSKFPTNIWTVSFQWIFSHAGREKVFLMQYLINITMVIWWMQWSCIGVKCVNTFISHSKMLPIDSQFVYFAAQKSFKLHQFLKNILWMLQMFVLKFHCLLMWRRVDLQIIIWKFLSKTFKLLKLSLSYHAHASNQTQKI